MLLVAVGSNGTPDVLHAKLHAAGVPCDATITPAVLPGIAIGHSAHVSARGYVPAAPYADPNAETPVRLLRLDGDQLAAVDATEPNYVRGTFPFGELYVSRWGVLSIDGVPVPLLPQLELHRLLRARLDRLSRARRGV